MSSQRERGDYSRLIATLAYEQHHNLPLHLLSAFQSEAKGSSWCGWPLSPDVVSRVGSGAAELQECIKNRFLRLAVDDLRKRGLEISDDDDEIAHELEPLIEEIRGKIDATLDGIMALRAGRPESARKHGKRDNWAILLGAASVHFDPDTILATSRRMEILLHEHMQWYEHKHHPKKEYGVFQGAKRRIDRQTQARKRRRLELASAEGESASREPETHQPSSSSSLPET